MKYAEIYNNSIVKIHLNLPGGWKNISGLNVLSNIDLADLSWSGNTGYAFYPVIEDSYPQNDSRFYRIEGPNYSVQDQTVIGTYTVTPKTQLEAWEVVRGNRNRRLYLSDWTQLPDAPLTAEKKAEWATYRQALRDITNQEDPFNISWPIEPTI